ncbi:THxN family PEP-CTERM protein [Alteromonas sp. ASW11-36]|uniref:THxN family PEP-CTERM protein n=1 Tax=Alteromonas arenosi TaxID=3055817 RepID=A0ABT7SVS4_9ALTE|nr:THxN family PEP-CTERM protein [Alteromonas sp. ASW11-36]MDM7859649.1 THxN family PEP-CTERM protein [Alteromonas sp. ASW11-36]
MNKFKLLAAAAALSVSSASFADPMIIQEWSFINEAGFKSFEQTATPPGAVNVPTLSGQSANGGTSILSTGELPDSLCWGDAVTLGGQSCLKINSPVSAATTQSWDEDGLLVDINGGAAQGNAFTADLDDDYTLFFNQGTALRHDNFPITGIFLDKVTIVDGLQLQAVAPAGVTVLAPELEFLVDFWETPNNGIDADGNCPFGPPSGTPGSVNGAGCADIFEVAGFAGGNIIAAGADFIDFAVNFTVGGVDPNVWHTTYQLVTRLSGLEVIGGNLGFATRENGVNVLNAQFAVRAIDAPEPSTIAIFALGLLGLAGMSRRKKA